MYKKYNISINIDDFSFIFGLFMYNEIVAISGNNRSAVLSRFLSYLYLEDYFLWQSVTVLEYRILIFWDKLSFIKTYDLLN